jgi:hypothetical protein
MRMTTINRRDAALTLASTLAGFGAAAQPAPGPRRYATMSLIGDQFTAIERQEKTGSRLDKNQQTEIKVGSDVLDRAALGVLNDLIVKADPAAKPLTLLVDEPVLYEKQARLFDDKFVRLPTSLIAAAKDGGATHLLLLTKQRTALNFRMIDGRVGQGAAEGLGFYVEPDLNVRNLDANQEATGFLGVYVHLRATVVDLGTEAIVGDRSIVVTDLYTNTGPNAKRGVPWDSLSAKEKVKAIGEMLMKALRDNVPALLKAT